LRLNIKRRPLRALPSRTRSENLSFSDIAYNADRLYLQRTIFTSKRLAQRLSRNLQHRQRSVANKLSVL